MVPVRPVGHEDNLTLVEHLDAQIAAGRRGAVIDGRVAFQTETEDEFTAEIERLRRRRVVAFMSANQTNPGVACELFFLEPTAGTASTDPAAERMDGER